MQRPATRIEVSVPEQQLQLFIGGQLAATFPVSTSKFGLGSEMDSNCTPLGSFQIKEKIGGDQPVRTIFRSRLPEGNWEPDEVVEDDLVLSRILWLDGLEPENANTFDRYIYIHGTNQEELIGRPASHGCVRMRNADMVDIYELVEPGTPVFIDDQSPL
jgi:lipoprotein-anchoring transpeptidase ErfK/SrfK